MEPDTQSSLFIDLNNWAIGLMSRVFMNGPGDRGSILGRVVPMTQNIFDSALLNTQHYNVRTIGAFGST